jgi:hypothetical protein
MILPPARASKDLNGACNTLDFWGNFLWLSYTPDTPKMSAVPLAINWQTATQQMYPAPKIAQPSEHRGGLNESH